MIKLNKLSTLKDAMDAVADKMKSELRVQFPLLDGKDEEGARVDVPSDRESHLLELVSDRFMFEDCTIPELLDILEILEKMDWVMECGTWHLKASEG